MKELGIITFGVVLLAIFAGTGVYPSWLRRGPRARVRARGRCRNPAPTSKLTPGTARCPPAPSATPHRRHSGQWFYKYRNGPLDENEGPRA